ncbi:hypothetical protein HCA58_03920 [Micromonospora sp. HNM0581]|uniref:hypothetical protein n=1 Tax=Micromonospora sp. HNM0581 TaxID=2716341 RepID=UPI00146D1AF2|nr:hypothetical protein [Micromonospora sp. HNM0581]NLU77555.1 hypothetical protein [Micromonospora sp. HNM0581]
MNSGEVCDGAVLDGFHVGRVPAGVGDETSDFATEWDDVSFASRVWERQTPEGHRADLRVHVLRGDRLVDLTALRDFLCEYHERDPVGWHLREFQHGSRVGLHDEVQAFWLVEPGVAVTVLTLPEFGDGLLPFARSIHTGDSGAAT